MTSCPNCGKEVNDAWKYCRFCGKAIKEAVPNKPEFKLDKKLYFDILSSRDKRSKIDKKRKELTDEISSLLEQLESGLISRDYAMPKVKKLKAEVDELKQEEEKLGDLPKTLPIEDLNNEIVHARERLAKIDDLKSDPAVSKESIREAKERASTSLNMLLEQQSLIFSKLRQWKAELTETRANERKALEQLYIRFKTGELTEEAYSEKKDIKAEYIHKLNNVIEQLQKILSI